MPLHIYRRNGFWHYAGTIGPPERRARIRKTTGLEDSKKNRAAAERHAAEVETNYWRGHFDGPASILTFAVAAQKYLEAGNSARFLSPVLDYLGNKMVKDIKPSAIRQMAIDLYPGKPPSQNRRAITVAQAVINFSASCELCPPIRVAHFDEFKKIKMPATLEWIQNFRAGANEIMGVYALFMFLTGCRPSEGLAIDRERDVDLKAATVVINNGKVGHERIAHMPAMLVSAIANMPFEPGRPLFWYYTYQTMLKEWDKGVAASKVKRLTPHCCRHGAVTYLLRAKIDVVTVGWLVDMTPEMVLQTYGHALKDATLTDLLLDTPLTRAFSEVLKSTAKTGTFGD